MLNPQSLYVVLNKSKAMFKFFGPVDELSLQLLEFGSWVKKNRRVLKIEIKCMNNMEVIMKQI